VVIDELTLSDFKTEEEMHRVFAKYGFKKLTLEELEQKSMEEQLEKEKTRQKDEASIRRKKTEAQRRQAEMNKVVKGGNNQRDPGQDMLWNMDEEIVKKAESERIRMKVEAIVKEQDMLEELDKDDGFIGSNSEDRHRREKEHHEVMQEIIKIEADVKVASKVKREYLQAMDMVEKGLKVLEEGETEILKAQADEADAILDKRRQLEGRARQLKNYRSVREDL
jgi:hypothetical protein